MNKELLYQKWIRSYEEDTEYEMVYRPETYHLPLRRGGREAIDLRSNNKLIQRTGGADDRYNNTEGEWSIEGDDIVAFKSFKSGLIRQKILTLTGDKLVLKK